MSEKLQDNFAYPPRLLRADRAAAYLDMSKSKFLELVDQGRLPTPVRIDGITSWDRRELDSAVEDLKGREGSQRSNPIEEHYGISGER
jgi:predicted DNA-binding transcriptional regulator AlpA